MRMNNLIITLLMFCNFSCEPLVDHVYRIWLKDNSEKGFVFLVNYNYPDTLISNEYDKLIGVPANKRVPYDSKEKWEEVFKGLPADTLTIFIFDGDTVASYEWEYIRNEYKILRRYDLSLQDLERLEWTVTYPPSENMSNIKMWP